VKPEKLSTIKKDLEGRKPKELVEICLRLGKLKTENKEMLTYLLLYAEDPLHYAGIIKKEMDEHFDTLSDHYYYSTKSLRKILRIVSKYSRFSGSREGELELLLHFTLRYIEKADLRSRHKPLQSILIRVLEKITKLIPRLHEDLQYDYSREYNRCVQLLRTKVSSRDAVWAGVKEISD
jgi:hypothetical protein